MDFEKVSTYIESLYENRKLTKKQYTKDTELKKFVPVVDDEVARMLQVLITLGKPQKILEIGTSVGFSTVSMAKAVKAYGGKITTIEFDAKVAEQAVKNFEREKVADQIEVKIGDAREIIPILTEQYDLIFQDVGDKALYAALLEKRVRLLKPGGLLVAENTLFPVIDLDKDISPDVEAKWEKMKEALAKFNKKVADCPRLESTLLPIGDGFTVAVKKE
ncbi:O-methyltransferase [Pectinatus frisingensis]|uniref:O-methyltransferase n=1 Tax=Pectinatus frisingensis TaxID=865 RepID=UPI0018C52C44|nr:O-methyltransferase [Pectinatus frisingensis]